MGAEWDWIPPTIVALLAFASAWKAQRNAAAARKEVKELHVTVDGQLTELLETTRALGESKGHAAGVEAERKRATGEER